MNLLHKLHGLQGEQLEDFAARRKGERETTPTQLGELASAVASREPNGGNSPDPIEVECISCAKMHKAIPRNYIGRGGYACSDNCWDEWVNFGRWERPE